MTAKKPAKTTATARLRRIAELRQAGIIGAREIDEIPVAFWTALAELVEAAKKLKPYCEDIVETLDGSPMVWDDDQSDEWNLQRIKDHNLLLERLIVLEVVEKEVMK